MAIRGLASDARWAKGNDSRCRQRPLTRRLLPRHEGHDSRSPFPAPQRPMMGRGAATTAVRLSRYAALPTTLIVLLTTAPAPAEPPPPEPATMEQLPPVVVIESTPVPALGTPIEKYAGNVQSVPAREIESQNLLDVPDLLYRRLGSVNTSSNQGNPWQTDFTYRGFLAS